ELDRRRPRGRGARRRRGGGARRHLALLPRPRRLGRAGGAAARAARLRAVRRPSGARRTRPARGVAAPPGLPPGGALRARALLRGGPRARLRRPGERRGALERLAGRRRRGVRAPRLPDERALLETAADLARRRRAAAIGGMRAGRSPRTVCAALLVASFGCGLGACDRAGKPALLELSDARELVADMRAQLHRSGEAAQRAIPPAS